MSSMLKRSIVAVALVACSATTLRSQNVTAFKNTIKDIDPSGAFVLHVEAEESLAWVYVSDSWYSLECFQRERIADNLRSLWRAAGGNQIVIKDKARKTVADFKIIGSGWKIKGC